MMSGDGFERNQASTPTEVFPSSEGHSAKIGAVALHGDKDQFGTAEVNPEANARKFINRYGPMLSLFARDSSLKFEPSLGADTFAFYPKEFKIEVPLSWFADEKYTEDELSFANHHEIAHFIDMRANPDAYLVNFEEMEQEAEKLTQTYLDKHPEKYSSKESIKKFFYQEIHSLYNVLDDIYVNNLVMSRNRFFDSGDGRDDIASLYTKMGYEEADLTSQPLHRQMIFSLLRDEMLGETHGGSVVDERVEAILSKKKLGKTIRELIDTELKPRRGLLVDPAERYKHIRMLIQPEYLELLEISLDEQEQQQNQQNESSASQSQQNQQNESNASRPQQQDQQNEQSTGVQSQSEFDPFKDQGKPQKSGILDHGENWDQIVEEVLDSLKEADEIDKMSEEERVEHQKQKAIKEFDTKHGISASERRENEAIKLEINKARKEMRRFWHNLIGKSIEYRQTIIKRQRKGRLNIDSYIGKYPEIIEAERNGRLRELEIYDQNGLERKIIDQPEVIDVSLLVDCSGSMNGAGETTARKAAALLMYSIKDFNSELERTRRETHSKLRANTEVIAFGSDYESIKSFEKTQIPDSNDAEIIKSISKINSNRGNTDDATPLGEILSRLSYEEKTRIRQQKLKKIVFEITDGAPNNPGKTRARLEELSREGVIVVGFQIGNVSDAERNLFDHIWNEENNPNKKGIFIGEDIASLPEALMRELSDLLSNIII